mmetsp:Transcript_20567/g.53155  ORF Transcript_20567/g.53155 Transcript_20567/m.53155 type:complete len:160 (+) Transcript_20567:356-835(+)
MQRRAHKQATFAVTNHLNEPVLPIAELRKRMEAGDESVYKALLGLMGNVPGTCGYCACRPRSASARAAAASRGGATCTTRCARPPSRWPWHSKLWHVPAVDVLGRAVRVALRDDQRYPAMMLTCRPPSPTIPRRVMLRAGVQPIYARRRGLTCKAPGVL